jgi:hypothetical protein
MPVTECFFCFTFKSIFVLGAVNTWQVQELISLAQITPTNPNVREIVEGGLQQLPELCTL